MPKFTTDPDNRTIYVPGYLSAETIENIVSALIERNDAVGVYFKHTDDGNTAIRFEKVNELIPHGNDKKFFMQISGLPHDGEYQGLGTYLMNAMKKINKVGQTRYVADSFYAIQTPPCVLVEINLSYDEEDSEVAREFFFGTVRDEFLIAIHKWLDDCPDMYANQMLKTIFHGTMLRLADMSDDEIKYLGENEERDDYWKKLF